MTLPEKTDSESKHFFDDNKKSILEMANKPIALLTIAQAHGIKVDTLSRRVLEGDDEFAVEFQKRRASLQANLASNVMDRGDGDWRMHAHVLELRSARIRLRLRRARLTGIFLVGFRRRTLRSAKLNLSKQKRSK